MNLQEIFDKTLTHLNKQQWLRSSSYGSDQCAYRGDNGRKCPVGALIADEHYGLHLESCCVDSNDVMDALQRSGVPIDEDTIRLLTDLQGFHDRFLPDTIEETPGVSDRATLRRGLRRMAKQYYLTVNEELLP